MIDEFAFMNYEQASTRRLLLLMSNSIYGVLSPQRHEGTFNPTIITEDHNAAMDDILNRNPALRQRLEIEKAKAEERQKYLKIKVNAEYSFIKPNYILQEKKPYIGHLTSKELENESNS